MFTTVQDIRERAGFLNFAVDSTLYEVVGSSNIWYAKKGEKDLERFVPRSYNGATLPTSVDVTVKHQGLSVGYSSFDINTGRITLSTGYASGSSLVATYASSPIATQKVYNYGINAHGMILAYVGKRYSLPLGVSVPVLGELEARLAAAELLIDSYGISGQNSAEDGYAMRQEILNQLVLLGNGSLPMIDSDGNEVPTSTDTTGGGNALSTGSRVEGYLFDDSEEEFDVILPADATRRRGYRWG